MNSEVERIISKFNLKPHPEGGYFGAGFRASEFLRQESLASRYDGPRNLYSSIYFMVTPDRPSRFHKLRTDEMWHFYAGDPMHINLIWDKGRHTEVVLNNQPGKEKFQTLVKHNTWMAATCEGPQGYSLVGCTLAPGFEYQDFELGDRDKLLAMYPEHRALITRLT